MNRRSFFSRLRTAIGVIALAPQLCFRVKPEVGLVQTGSYGCWKIVSFADVKRDYETQRLMHQYEMNAIDPNTYNFQDAFMDFTSKKAQP